MNKSLLWVLFGIFLHAFSFTNSFAQIKLVGKDTLCIGEPLIFQNIPNALKHNWDFCNGELFTNPTADIVQRFPELINPQDIKLIEDEGDYYLFVLTLRHGLFRLDFGNDLDNLPELHHLGNFVDEQIESTAIDFYKEDNRWFGFFTNNHLFINLIRLDFGNRLDNFPLASVIENHGKIAYLNGLRIVKDQENYKILVNQSTDRELTVINFGRSLINHPSPVDFLNSGRLPVTTVGLEVLFWRNAWHAFLVANNGRLFRLDYGPDLLGRPEVHEIEDTQDILVQPRKFSLEIDRGEPLLFLSSNVGNILRFSFPTSNMFPKIEDLGNLGNIDRINTRLDFIKTEKGWKGFTVNTNQREIYEVGFPDKCASVERLSSIKEPSNIYWEQGGWKYIGLETESSNGQVRYYTDSVFVKLRPIPDFEFVDGCLGRNTSFYNLTNDGGTEIVSWEWNFGDPSSGSKNFSSLKNPVHTYNAVGVYEVVLKVEDECHFVKTISKEISIHREHDIIPDFRFPDLVCSFDSILFEDASSFQFDRIVKWDWYFENDKGHTDSYNTQSPQYYYNAPGAYLVKLQVTGESGCQYEMQKQIEVQEGAYAAFNYHFNCEGATTQFYDKSVAPHSEIVAYEWDFDDPKSEGLNFSDKPDPFHAFTGPGIYLVQLTVEIASGCNTSLTKRVQIFETPRPSFSNGPMLKNEAYIFKAFELGNGDEIAGYSWYFGDPDGGEMNTSQLKNPSYTYQQEGRYLVKLEITTKSGCIGYHEQEVEVWEPSGSGFPEPKFIVDDVFCTEEPISLTNISQGGTSYLWDFCEGDLQYPPRVIEMERYVEAVNPHSIKIIEDQGFWHAFVISRSNLLLRLDFEEGLDQQPLLYNLGNLDSLLVDPRDIAFTYEGGYWYALITNYTLPSSILRLSFGKSLKNEPEVTILPDNPFLHQPNGLDIFYSEGKTYAGVVNYGRREVLVLDFGMSIRNAPQVTNRSQAIPNSSGLFGIRFINNQNEWFAITSSNNGTVHKLSYGNNFVQNPTIEQVVYKHRPFNNLRFLELGMDMGKVYAFIMSLNDGLLKIDLGESLKTDPFAFTYLGTSDTLERNNAFALVKEGSTWRGFTMNHSTRYLYRLDFPDSCHAFPTWSNEFYPPKINYSQGGDYVISLNSKNNKGENATYYDTIRVRQRLKLSFKTEKACAGTPVKFTNQTYPGETEVLSWYWDFGDPESGENNTSRLRSPDHVYGKPGIYVVKLYTEDECGYKDFFEKEVLIYESDDIAPDFEFPASFCSNKPLQFTDLSTFANDSIVSWQWDFGDELEQENYSILQHPVHTFKNAGEHFIILTVTGESGCQYLVEKRVTITQGTAVDFIFSGNCEGQAVSFKDISDLGGTGFVSRQWDFGNPESGEVNFSDDAEPNHTYFSPGIYTVTLKILNSEGCDTEISKSIEIFRHPKAEIADGAGIQGGPYLFFLSNLISADEIETYEWDFGDPFSGELNFSDEAKPQHIFMHEGNYKVSLLLTTKSGCSSFIEKNLRVYPQANLDFPSTVFQSRETICQEEPVRFTNNSSGATRFEWDFCEGDLSETPTASSLGLFRSVANPQHLEVIKDQGQWHAFVLTSNSRLVRFDFGDSLHHTPVEVDLDNIGGLFYAPRALQLYKENGEWFGLLANYSLPSELVRLRFGNSLKNEPVAENVLDIIPQVQNPNGMKIINHQGEVVVVLTNATARNLVMINFGNSITNTPNPETDVLVSNQVFTSGTLYGLDIIKWENQWIGAVSFTNGRIMGLRFGSNIFSVPQSFELFSNNQGIVNPRQMQFAIDKGEIFVFIKSFNGELYRVGLGKSFNTSQKLLTDFGNLVMMDRNVAFAMTKENSQWYGFTINQTPTRDFIRIDFPNNCSASLGQSSATEPEGVFYKAPGLVSVGLKGFDNYGNVHYFNKDILVNDNVALEVNLLVSDNKCIEQPNFFEAQVVSDLDIKNFFWDFGDGDTKEGQSVQHHYSSPGQYTIRLNVESESGCAVGIEKTINIYERPLPDFEIKGNCSFAPTSFINQTQGYYKPDDIEWFWDFNGEGSSKEENPVFIFTSSGTKFITLTAGLPGCPESITKPYEFKEGAEVNFDFSGDFCATSTVHFLSETEGANIVSYFWDFGDGFSSSLKDPVHTYENGGAYFVNLKVENTNGCVTSRTSSISINSLPVNSFVHELACNGLETSFYDQSTVHNANVVDWHWYFEDRELGMPSKPSSFLKDPKHTFTEPGKYKVRLVTISDMGCENITEKVIEVLQSIDPDFDSYVTCSGKFSQFLLAEGVSDKELDVAIWEIDGNIYEGKRIDHIFKAPGRYFVTLNLRSENRCTSSITRYVDVIDDLGPFFSNNMACPGQFIDFNAFVENEMGTIVDWEWTFNNNYFISGQSVQHAFANAGTFPVTLKVTDINGCNSSYTKYVDISNNPTAEFEPSTLKGPYPLTVYFKNQSLHSNRFIWDFDRISGNVSYDKEPTYTFEKAGIYQVILKAYNERECEDVYTKMIEVVEPELNIAIENVSLTITENVQHSVILVANKGTVSVHKLRFKVLFNGEYIGYQDVDQTIPVAESINISLDKLSIAKGIKSVICVEVEILESGIEELVTMDNFFCMNMEDIFSVMPPAPNPVKDFLKLTVLIPEKEKLFISIQDLLGKTLMTHEFSHTNKGMNYLQFDVKGFRKGVYLIRVRFKDKEEVKKFVTK